MMDVEYIYELKGSGIQVGSNAVIPKELQEFSKRGFVPQARVESYLLSLRASEKFAKDRH